MQWKSYNNNNEDIFIDYSIMRARF